MDDDNSVPQLDTADGGLGSRKLWFSVGTSALIFAGGVMAGLWGVFGPHYETMISGLIGMAGLYMTGNVGSRWVTAKHIAAVADAVKATKAADKAPAKADPEAPVEPLPEE